MTPTQVSRVSRRLRLVVNLITLVVVCFSLVVEYTTPPSHIMSVVGVILCCFLVVAAWNFNRIFRRTYEQRRP